MSNFIDRVLFLTGGFFVTLIYIIKDCDWENPLIRKECKDINTLKKHTIDCIILIQSIVNVKN